MDRSSVAYGSQTGPSLLTLPAVYRDLFLKTGGALEDAIDLQDLEPAFGYRFSDGTALPFMTWLTVTVKLVPLSDTDDVRLAPVWSRAWITLTK